MKYKNFIGQKFNKLTIIEYKGCNKNGTAMWLCKCDCGNKKIIKAFDVKNGNTKSCECLNYQFINIANKKFTKLVALKYLTNSNWLCACKCGNTCIVKYHDLHHNKVKSCGCYFKSKSYIPKGKNSPYWNHNLSNKERLIQEENRQLNPRHVRWRKKVYQRDNYTCKICNQHGGRLAAHHIYSWNTHKKLRYTISNGITLCQKCHKNFHKIYKNGNNTRKQLNKFIHDVQKF